MEVRIKFSADVYIKGDNMAEVREKFENLALFSADALEEAITDNTKAIIPVDLGGIPCDYDTIFEIVERKKNIFKAKNDIQKAIGRIAVVTDAAHAFGASYRGKMVGSIGDFTAYSFVEHKNITACKPFTEKEIIVA